jgi:serine/threonine-protein kinase HipA
MSKGHIYFKDSQVGLLEKKTDAAFQFDYLPGKQSVSWTLPNKNSSFTSEELFPFFDGLIPEGWLLNLAQKNWKIPKNDRMSLLLTTCQDCIGAAHIRGENESSKSSIHSKKKLSEYIPTETSDRCLICLADLGTENLYHAKCAKSLFGFSHPPIIDLAAADLDELALLQINQRLTLTGVQKKLSLSPIKDEKKERLTVLGLDGRFILKPSTEEYPEMAEIEHLSMKLASQQQIQIADCGLVYLSSGERAYITRRFDRVDGEKIQVEDFCQLSEKATEKKYHGSSESLGKVIDKYSSQPQDDKLTLFEVVVFSFWIGNADMHLKNFSLWRDPASNLVRMSPGYDFVSTRLLIPANEDNEELALPINGRKNKLKWSDFLAFGSHLKIPAKVMERVRDKMLDSFFDAENLIERSFLSDQKKEAFSNLITERSTRLT